MDHTQDTTKPSERKRNRKESVSLTLLETPEFGNVDCTVIVTAFRDGKEIGTLNTELTLHVAYLWPKEVQ